MRLANAKQSGCGLFGDEIFGRVLLFFALQAPDQNA
jgi:hypothetical protein